jgi:hypothetical protein
MEDRTRPRHRPWNGAPWLDPLEDLRLLAKDDDVLEADSEQRNDIPTAAPGAIGATAVLETTSARYVATGEGDDPLDAKRMAAANLLQKVREDEPELVATLDRRQQRLAAQRARRASKKAAKAAVDAAARAEQPLVHPGVLRVLEPGDPLADGTVLDFWRWALGDLRMNNARGYLAEYLVARAVGDPRPMRIEWGEHDVEAADGTRIEVKATGRLQSWASPGLTPPAWTFSSVRADKTWSAKSGRYEPVDPWDRVHVWVFALQTAKDPDAYDPLDTAAWEFRVLPHRQLLATGQTSARLATIERLGGHPVPLAGLREEIARARRRNDGIAPSRGPGATG